MPEAAKPDALVAGRPTPLAYVLIQTTPKIEVLAVSESKDSLVQEMRELCEDATATGLPSRALLVQPTNIPFA